MRIQHAQITLLAMFLASLLLHLVLFAYTFIAGAVYVEDVQTLAVHILSIYSVPIGIILGGIFGGTAKSKKRAPSSTLWTAIALSILWNVLLVFRSLTFAIVDNDSIMSLLNYIDTVAGAGTFLIGAALAYFFAKGVVDD